MARPFSVRFMHGYGSGIYTRFIVPSGKRAVIRNVLAWSGTTGHRYWLLLQASNVRYWSSPGAGSTDNLETRCVAYAGETIETYTDGDTIHVWVSGYLFDDGPAVTSLPADEPVRVEGEPPPLAPTEP